MKKGSKGCCLDGLPSVVRYRESAEVGDKKGGADHLIIR